MVPPINIINNIKLLLNAILNRPLSRIPIELNDDVNALFPSISQRIPLQQVISDYRMIRKNINRSLVLALQLDANSLDPEIAEVQDQIQTTQDEIDAINAVWQNEGTADAEAFLLLQTFSLRNLKRDYDTAQIEVSRLKVQLSQLVNNNAPQPQRDLVNVDLSRARVVRNNARTALRQEEERINQLENEFRITLPTLQQLLQDKQNDLHDYQQAKLSMPQLITALNNLTKFEARIVNNPNPNEAKKEILHLKKTILWIINRFIDPLQSFL
ncbi:hypothetical protein ACFLZN_01750 [Nanoarchaeota archaeon]